MAEPLAYSIHPRKRLNGPKLNTCGVANPNRKRKLIETLTQRIVEHPRDGMTAARLQKLITG